MKKGRIEAFSDGVIAIIITIMVLEIRVPHGSDFVNLIPLLPVISSYILSFIFLGIYWNNHHHLIQCAERINGSIMWANLHLLFWLSLTPFVTAWMGENNFAPATLMVYGVILLMSSISYYILQMLIVKANGKDSKLSQSIGNDFKGKISPVLYLLGIATSYFYPWLSGSFYVLVALIWLVPDKRLEKLSYEN
jgi:uncharacterized membrane protein